MFATSCCRRVLREKVQVSPFQKIAGVLRKNEGTPEGPRRIRIQLSSDWYQHAGNPCSVYAIFNCPLSSCLHNHLHRSAYVVNKLSLISTLNNLTLNNWFLPKSPFIDSLPFQSQPPSLARPPLSASPGCLRTCPEPKAHCWNPHQVGSFQLLFLSLWKVFL